MNTHDFRNLMACCAAVFCAGCMGPAVTDAVVKPMISAAPPKHLVAKDDPFNAAMLSNLAPGLIAVVRVRPDKVELVQAYIMLTLNFARHVEGPGDRIVATLSSGGSKVSDTAISDPNVAIEEDFGDRGPRRARTVHKDERSVALSLPIPHRVDTLDVAVSATGQVARFDVSRLLEAYCEKEPRSPSCQTASLAQAR